MKRGALKGKKKKIFKIMKISNEDEYLKEILGESDNEGTNINIDPSNFENEDKNSSLSSNSSEILKTKGSHFRLCMDTGTPKKLTRVDPFSKVNFAQLTLEQKEKRLKNLAKVVKKMKRQLTNIELKMKKKCSKTS